MTNNHHDHDAAVYARPDAELYHEAHERALSSIPSIQLSNFPQLNYATGGLRPKEFSILCGATGVGKTTLLANLSAGLIKNEIPHFVASVETGPVDYMLRVLSSLSGIDVNHGGKVPLETMQKIHAEFGHLLTRGRLNLSLYENRFSVVTLMRDIQWHLDNRGCRLAMIDNLNFFMEVTAASNQVIEMDRVIHELIIFCKTVDVHVIMVMHPKKTEHGRVESEFDIKGSSTAVQEAHNVFLFNRPSQQSIDSGAAGKYDRELKIAKMRRRGLAVGAEIIFTQVQGVKYVEQTRFTNAT